MGSKLSALDLTSMVLAGAREEQLGSDGGDLFLRGGDEDVMGTLYANRDKSPLILEHYRFDTQGAFPYSREVRENFGFLIDECRCGHHIVGEPGVYFTKVSETFGRFALKDGRIPQEDFDAFIEIGKQMIRESQ